jgi:predicted ABC-type ATPase
VTDTTIYKPWLGRFAADFSPDQPRDKNGKWSKTGLGGGHKLPFHDEGGVTHFDDHLGVERKDMPQLTGTTADGTYHPSAEMVPKFRKFLAGKGVKTTVERVPASSLKPTQTTGGTKQIRGIANELKSGELKDTKPILVSSDNRVIDGHHNWAGRLTADSEGGRKGLEEGMPVLRAHAPAAQVLGGAEEFGKQEGIAHRATGEDANPAFKALKTSKTPVPVDTYTQYRNADGSWDPKRQQLHDQIVNHFIGGRQSEEHPVATFFGGGPASGKSALKAPEHAVKVDPDEIKAMLPEYQEGLRNNDPTAASKVHEESSHLAARVKSEAEAKKISYTLDGTGDSSYKKMAGKVNAARAAGFKTHGQYVTVDTDEAVKRAMKRAEHTGRMVPEPVIRATHASVSSTFGQAAANNLFDHVELYDNNGDGAAKKIATTKNGKFNVLDSNAYKRFLDKAES